MGSQAVKPQYCLTDSIAFKANCPVSSTLESKIAILAKKDQLSNYQLPNWSESDNCNLKCMDIEAASFLGFMFNLLGYHSARSKVQGPELQLNKLSTFTDLICQLKRVLYRKKKSGISFYSIGKITSIPWCQKYRFQEMNN